MIFIMRNSNEQDASNSGSSFDHFKSKALDRAEDGNLNEPNKDDSIGK